jgi:hypothetical protein
MKRYLQSPCAVLALAFSFLALQAHAQFEYTTNNGTITITRYTGPGGEPNPPLKLVDVTIPSTINGLPVTSIGETAFMRCYGVTTVKIPGTVTTIGKSAFNTCLCLTNVTMGGGVTTIGEYAFVGCDNLTSITMPASIRSIGYGALATISMVTGGKVYFLGDATRLQADKIFWFMGRPPVNNKAIAYYLPWADGWGPTFDGIPTEPWNPLDWLVALVDALPVRNTNPLVTSLAAAQKTIAHGNFSAAANHLRTFQKKVRAQVADGASSRELIESAQQVIDAL